MARSATAVKGRKRRTQAERRAATRTALLDAAVDCLAEEGYARTTKLRIAERAGVSSGALQHHFASKAELLGEATRHISARMATEWLAQGEPDARSMRGRHEQLLDRMWAIYRGPLFRAALQLVVAAYTDPELRAQRVGAQQEIARWNKAGAQLLYPQLAGRPELGPLIATGQATMRGLAMAGLAGEVDVDKAWPTTREHILAQGAAVLGEPELWP
jgi:AcrR family transcriptional regulator